MGCDFAAHARRRADDLLQLVHFHLLPGARGTLRHDATRRGDLDQVAAVLDDIARRSAAVKGTVAHVDRGPLLHEFGTDAADIGVASRDAYAAGRNYARAVDPAPLDGIAHRVHFLPRRADVADRRKAGHERIPGVVQASHLHQLARHLQRVPVVVRSQLALEVHMHVHEAREHEFVAEVDDRCPFDVRKTLLQSRYAITLDDDSHLPRGRLSRHCQQFAGVDQCYFSVGCRHCN